MSRLVAENWLEGQYQPAKKGTEFNKHLKQTTTQEAIAHGSIQNSTIIKDKKTLKV